MTNTKNSINNCNDTVFNRLYKAKQPQTSTKNLNIDFNDRTTSIKRAAQLKKGIFSEHFDVHEKGNFDFKVNRVSNYKDEEKRKAWYELNFDEVRDLHLNPPVQIIQKLINPEEIITSRTIDQKEKIGFGSSIKARIDMNELNSMDKTINQSKKEKNVLPVNVRSIRKKRIDIEEEILFVSNQIRTLTIDSKRRELELKSIIQNGTASSNKRLNGLQNKLNHLIQNAKSSAIQKMEEKKNRTLPNYANYDEKLKDWEMNRLRFLSNNQKVDESIRRIKEKEDQYVSIWRKGRKGMIKFSRLLQHHGVIRMIYQNKLITLKKYEFNPNFNSLEIAKDLLHQWKAGLIKWYEPGLSHPKKTGNDSNISHETTSHSLKIVVEDVKKRSSSPLVISTNDRTEPVASSMISHLKSTGKKISFSNSFSSNDDLLKSQSVDGSINILKPNRMNRSDSSISNLNFNTTSLDEGLIIPSEPNLLSSRTNSNKQSSSQRGNRSVSIEERPDTSDGTFKASNGKSPFLDVRFRTPSGTFIENPDIIQQIVNRNCIDAALHNDEVTVYKYGSVILRHYVTGNETKREHNLRTRHTKKAIPSKSTIR